MEFVFNPIRNKIPQGPCQAGDDVTYTVKISRFTACDSLYFVMIDDRTNKTKKIKMPLYSCDEAYFTYKATINYKKEGLYWYYFEIYNTGGNFFLCKSPSFDVEPNSKVNMSFSQLVNIKPATINEDYNQGIIYHIFVDRFRKSGKVICKDGMIFRPDWGGDMNKNSDDFLVINQECFGGNLQGVIDKLPYIKSLGTATIFLSPIFESYSYHKYDIANYEEVDSMFGGWEVFEKLIEEAGKLGIKILLDGVFNHVGSDSVYFNRLARFKTVGAYQSKQSKYLDWFEFEKYPSKYQCWWGIDTLPQLNESSESLRKYVAGKNGIVEKYIKSGILGFRLDVVDELTDIYLDEICTRAKQVNPKALIMGEVWEDAATKIAYDKRRHYFDGTQLDSVMNYPLKNGIIDFVMHGNAEGLANVFYMLKDHYPEVVQNNLMNFLGTHDTKRILAILKENNEKNAFQMLRIASAIQYLSPGVPAVFYGDEVGVIGGNFKRDSVREKNKDYNGEAPFCRVCFPWGSEDKDILTWYKKLGKLRSDKIFAHGKSEVLFAHNGVFIFSRFDETKRIVIAANCGHEDFKLNLQKSMKNIETGKMVKNLLMLKPFEFVILGQ